MNASLVPNATEPGGGPRVFLFKENLCTKALQHTVGRVSCAVRAPLYAVAASVQLAKIGIKLPICAVLYMMSPFINLAKAIISFARGDNLDYKVDGLTNRVSVQGLARDAMVAYFLLDKALDSILLTVVAPPKEYRPLLPSKSEKSSEAGSENSSDKGGKVSVLEVVKNSVLGKYHGNSNHGEVPLQSLRQSLHIMNVGVDGSVSPLQKISPIFRNQKAADQFKEIGDKING